MNEKIKIGIVGYGNLGRGIEINIDNHNDLELIGIFSRRQLEDSKTKRGNTIFPITKIMDFRDKIDVMVMCGGSHTDLPEQVRDFSRYFNTVDSYDNHKGIPEYFESIDNSSKGNNKTSIISIGWDPGLFSLNRMIFESILPNGKFYTFWGKGVSQGHSQVLKSIDGVKYGVQYTVPIEETLESIRQGNNPELKPEEMHKRICYVVSEDDNENNRIENEIKNIPSYFLGYETEVNFITEEEYFKNHTNMPHGGVVIHSGKTSKEHSHTMEFKLNLENNPEFTSAVLVAFARACYRLSKENKFGAYTIFDIPLSYISPYSIYDLRKNIL